MRESGKEKTRDLILCEAKRMFREQGFTKMRMVELAKNLGISRGNLSYYFTNKDALLESIWDDYDKRIYAWIDNSDLPFFNNMSRKLYHMMIFDINNLSDSAIRDFYYDQMYSDGYTSFSKRSTWDFINSIIDNGYIHLNASELSYLLVSLQGSYRFMDTKFITEGKIDLLQYILIKQKIRINMFSAAQPNTLSDLEAAVEELKRRDFSGIRCI